MISNDLLIKIVNDTLDLIYEKEYVLIKNNLHEISIVNTFAYYFRIILKEKLNNIDDFSVDIEYNRDVLSESKLKSIIYNGEKYDIRPDLIFHKRESNDKNILVIEFKKSTNNSDRESDLRKLNALTLNEGQYRYQLGLYIEFEKKEKM